MHIFLHFECSTFLQVSPHFPAFWVQQFPTNECTFSCILSAAFSYQLGLIFLHFECSSFILYFILITYFPPFWVHIFLNFKYSAFLLPESAANGNGLLAQHSGLGDQLEKNGRIIICQKASYSAQTQKSPVKMQGKLPKLILNRRRFFGPLGYMDYLGSFAHF